MTQNIMSTKQRTILWIVRALAASAFILFGTMKLLGVPMMVTVFDQVGLGQWFRYATGGIEVFGALLLLSPRYVGAAALLLAATSAGAIVSHLTRVPGSPAPAVILLALCASIAWSYRRQTVSLLGRESAA